jgi:integrase
MDFKSCASASSATPAYRLSLFAQERFRILQESCYPPCSMGNTLIETSTHPKYPRLSLDLRTDSPFYQARIYLDGKQRQWSTKAKTLAGAQKVSEEWYRKQLRESDLKQREHPLEEVTQDTLITELYQSYASTLNERQQVWADWRWGPIRGFWGSLGLQEVTSKTFEDFYRWRKKVRPHTLHKDVCLIRKVLKHAAVRHREFSMPLIPSHARIVANPRPWLTQAEWDHLQATALRRIDEVRSNRKFMQQRQDMFDFARFMVASMCRVDELRNLQFKHCQVDLVGKRKILRCEFKGKTGTRVAFASPEAVKVYERRLGDDPEALIFPVGQRDAFRALLKAAKLYTDHFGNRRNLKSLRATSISLAILRPNPPTLFQIARNAGTSVNVIENFYAKRLTAESGKDVLTATEPATNLW